ncbi:BTAD domain-containing putative transcriptional regulator [Nonomuraea thailandensis]
MTGPRELVPGLRELVGRHPLRERPAALLMRALAAGGEQGLPEPVVEAVSAR